MFTEPEWGQYPPLDDIDDEPVSPGPDGATVTELGPEVIAILLVCLGTPILIIIIVMCGKRCSRRFKRRREIRDGLHDLEGYDNAGLEYEEHRPGLVRSVGGSVVIVNGMISSSPLPGRHKPKRCYDDDGIDYGEEAPSAFPEDILAEIDEVHAKTKENGIEVQLDDRLKAASLSDASSYSQDHNPDRSQMNGYANGHLPQNGVKCTAISTVTEVLKETLAKNYNNNNELSLTDCEIIIHALCEEDNKEGKVKQNPIFHDECPLRRLAPERMTMPTIPIPFPKRKHSSASIRSLKGSRNAESWLHSAYISRSMTHDRPE